jgi:hypothetical protein
MTESGDREELYGDTVYQSGDAVDDTDGLDPIESLTGDDPDEAAQTGYSPPEREPYNLKHFPTPREEHDGESLDERLREEEPDVSADDIDEADADPRAGRIVGDDNDAEDVGPAGYGSSAEEAAVHIQDEDELE